MRIVKRVLSTYSADNFGVCSALYELGGLVVMHDASGCNSTYNTHDEPRWYNMDSLVFISGLTEKNAIFGNDDKLIGDLVTAANEFHPRFIAVCGGPLPHIIGTDFRAVAKAVERQCGIPTFGFQTNGMDSYISGAGQALESLVDMMRKRDRTDTGKGKAKINILGVTPLDFSLTGSVEALRMLLKKEGFEVGSTWAMGDDLDNLLQSSDAAANLVVSAVGRRAAVAMEKKLGIPYVVGLPAGKQVTRRIVAELRKKVIFRGEVGKDGTELIATDGTDIQSTDQPAGVPDIQATDQPAGVPDIQATDQIAGRPDTQPTGQIAGSSEATDILIIGEPIQSLSIRETLENSFGEKNIRIISPMHGLPREIISLGCEKIELEDELREACRAAKRVIADPLYARLLPKEQEKFIHLPHVAYSGRYYENEVPVLVGEALDWWLESAFEVR